jgi:hypothetical protein
MPRQNSNCSRLQIVCIQYNVKVNKRIKEKKKIKGRVKNFFNVQHHMP